METKFSNTLLLEYKTLCYLKVEPIWGLYGLTVLTSSICMIFLLFYAFYLRYGVHPFDDTTFRLLREISILDTSMFLLLLVFMYLLSISFISNFFYAAAHYAILNRSSFWESITSQISNGIQILNYSCFYTAMFFVEDNFIEIALFHLVFKYGQALNVDLHEPDIIGQRVSGMLLTLTIISIDKMNLKSAIFKSGQLLNAKLGVNGELNPKFSFMTWDFSLFCITLVAVLLHLIFWHFVDPGVAFVSFFVALQVLLAISRFARAIFSHIVYKYCTGASLSPFYSKLVLANYTTK